MDWVLPFIKTVFKNLSVLLLLLPLAAYSSVAFGNKPDTPGVITAGGAAMRAAPNNASRSIKTLSKGTQVRILLSEKNWYKIEHGGKTGYIRRGDLQVTKVAIDPAGAPPSVQALKQKAHRIDTKIDQKEKEITAFSDTEAKIIETLDRIDSSLNAAEQKTSALQKEVAGLTAELKKKESTLHALEQEVTELEIYAARRLVSFYKLGRLGTLPLIASAESLLDMLSRKKYLEKLLEQDQSVLKTLSEKKATIAISKKELVNQRQTLQAQVEEFEGQSRSLSRRRAERTTMLAGIQAKKALALAAVASLKESAAALDEQILEAMRHPPEPPPPPPKPPESSHVEPRDRKDALTLPEPKSTDEFKGLLNLPVNGKIISFFGPYTLPHVNMPGFKSGIDIQAEMGEPIRAVKGGTAIYSGWFKGYGNMLILDHGNSYCTVYTHAQELFKKKGDIVQSGEVIASVGDTCSLEGPKLHFEIRHHGKPIDPLKWMEKRSQN